jgi:hypothetical protein
VLGLFLNSLSKSNSPICQIRVSDFTSFNSATNLLNFLGIPIHPL